MKQVERISPPSPLAPTELGLLQDLESRPLPEKRKELIREAWQRLKQSAEQAGGVLLAQDLAEALREQEVGAMLVRREDPQRLFDVLEASRDVAIQGAPGQANAVQWDPSLGPEALQTALTEGYGGRGGLVTAVGWIPDSTVQARRVAARSSDRVPRDYVRDVVGAIHPADIRFLLVRIPSGFFPEDELTDDEQEMAELHPRTPVVRSFLFSHGARASVSRAA